MTSSTPTGPSTPTATPALGRWQQPAAAIQAGLVPADPYPLEKILFCATCGQQFFGTHQPGGTDEPGGTRVAGDTHEPGDIDQASDTNQTDVAHAGDDRVYRTFCEHRSHPLPADEVELRVYAETHVLAFGTDAIAGLSNAHYALLALRFFTRIELGSTSDEINFSARI